MNREMQIVPTKTYATKENARKAVLKTGDEGIRHTYLLTEEGRWFPCFFPNPDQLSLTGIHFRWNVIC